jgi:predicted nicotinamide N-methyase
MSFAPLASVAAQSPIASAAEHYEYLYSFDEQLWPTLAPLEILQSATGTGGIGSTVWDSALVLARYLEHSTKDRSTWRGKKILELGSGTGLLGLVAARLFEGSRVTLTDKHVGLAKMNVEKTGLAESVEVVELAWGIEYLEKAKGLEAPYDLILLSDCVHWPDLFQPLVDTLYALAGPETEILMAYEKRIFEDEIPFFAKLKEKGLSFKNVPESGQHPDYRGEEDIWLFRIWKRAA